MPSAPRLNSPLICSVRCHLTPLFTTLTLASIASYLNVDFSANVTLRVAYVSGLPHVLVVCRAGIEPGDELLLDYGQVTITPTLTLTLALRTTAR